MTRETLNFGQLLETLALVYLVAKYPRWRHYDIRDCLH